jgi:Leucine-rich repeat (LRR) protein
MTSMQIAYRVSALTVTLALALVCGACGKNLEGIAKQDDALGADAKAVVAALAKSALSPEKVKVVDQWADALAHSSDRKRGAVVVSEGRITHINFVGVTVDTKPLGKLAELQRLDINFGGTTRVEGLAKLPKLKTLDLSHNKITHLIGLEDLPALRKLVLKENPLKVVSGIKNVGLPGLDFSPFRTLERLEKLENLPRMIRIAAAGNKLKRFAVAKLPKLVSVVLKNNALQSLRLEDLPALQVLNAQGNQLTKVVLRKLPALTHISLSENKLRALPAVGGPKKLKMVLLNKNRISSLAGIEQLPAKELFLDNNQLTDLDPTPLAQRTAESKPKPVSAAASLPTFVTLAVERNKLTSLAGVERLVNLKHLYLDRNQLRSLAGAEKLKKLKKLRVSHNKLKALTPLQADQLEELIATDNQIAAAPDVFGPAGNKRPKIKRYDLRRNAITGVAAALLFYGLTRPSYRGTYVPSRRSRSGGGRGYRGSRGYRSRGSRYSSGGGYRSGK